MKFFKKLKTVLKRSYAKTVMLGFGAFFIVSMLLCTYLVSRQQEGAYLKNAGLQMEQVRNTIFDASQNGEWNPKNLTPEQIGELTKILSYEPDMYDKYQPFSFALYDHKGNLVTQSTNFIEASYLIPGISIYSNTATRIYSMESIFSDSEINELAKLKGQNYKDFFTSVKPLMDDPVKKGPFNERCTYGVKLGLTPETYELAEYIVSKQEWSEPKVSDDGKPYVFQLENEAEVWRWETDSDSTDLINGICVYDVGFFPYMSEGYDTWHSWYTDPYLQNYPDKIESAYDSSHSLTYFYNDGLSYNSIAPVNFANDINESNTYMLVMRYTTSQWLSAINTMKYIYLWGLLLAIICIIKVLFSTEKAYQKQITLEETRRDFTNAIAHELKTPLGAIRGITENLKEHTVPDKQEYYFDQIIGQTEEMDKLVQEMIYVSKLDSDKLVLANDSVSILAILREEFKKINTAVEEKHLHITFDVKEDFLVNGDIKYLEKAVYNLVENAVEYNCDGGTIKVISNKDNLQIINTGTTLSQEELSHVFDMFYTSDKSRSTANKHYGLGLYLAKKILSLHHLAIKMETCENEIITTISK